MNKRDFDKDNMLAIVVPSLSVHILKDWTMY